MVVATKHDIGKPPMSLLPYRALEQVAYVLDFGRKKYGPYNWATGMEWSRLIDAAQRHIGQWGETANSGPDPETGLSHLAHAVCNLLFLLEYEVKKLGVDDRFRPASQAGPYTITARYTANSTAVVTQSEPKEDVRE